MGSSGSDDRAAIPASTSGFHVITDNNPHTQATCNAIVGTNSFYFGYQISAYSTLRDTL